ncbi:hypothetical protein BGZ83_009151 [Gryganskiella cystojenkinii]|nr:hypothetical protein BGZ83_009151 [Gryganskiella cystojenkinii]
MSEGAHRTLTWNNAHTINTEGEYCYCRQDRRLDELALQCRGCSDWFHASCIEISLGPVVPFITNYKFYCKHCVLKSLNNKSPNNRSAIKVQEGEPESFQRVTAGWKEICATALANLIVQEYLFEANKNTGNDPSLPMEDNMWSKNAARMDWEKHMFYFNKKDFILPYVDRHWAALCTDRARTTTWWATLGSCLYISKDVFATFDEQARSASSDFCLTKSNLWEVKPGFITVRAQQPGARSGSKGPTTVKRKGAGSTGDRESPKPKKAANGTSISTSTSTKPEKSAKKPTSSGNRQKNQSNATATTFIPLPHTVVANNSSGGTTNLVPFSATNEHPYNRHRFRYVTCESDPLLQYMLYRQSANPVLSGVRLSREDMSPYMQIDDECKTITTEKGFRTVRANCGVREGKWYYEVTVRRGGEVRYEGRDGAHVRLGWARREATLQAPAGFDAYSYGIRDTTGEKVHMSRVQPYGESFKEGDVIGLYISLPPDGNENSFFKHRRLRKPFMFKGQLYFESIDYSPTKKYVELAEYEATPFQSLSARPDPPERPPMIPGSKIIVYKNGVCQGVMFEDLFALMPIEQNAKERDQITFDDGTLGYYPCVSVYRNGTATVNFGPEFTYPPGPDPEEEARKVSSTRDQQRSVVKREAALSSSTENNVWKPMSERWDEMLVEECLIDLVDEVELWVSESARLLAASNAPPKMSPPRKERRTLRDDYASSPGANSGGDFDDYEVSSISGNNRPRVRSNLGREQDGEDTDGDIGMDSGIDRDQDEGPQSPHEPEDDRDEMDMDLDPDQDRYQDLDRDQDQDRDLEGSLLDDERENHSHYEEEYEEHSDDDDDRRYSEPSTMEAIKDKAVNLVDRVTGKHHGHTDNAGVHTTGPSGATGLATNPNSTINNPNLNNNAQTGSSYLPPGANPSTVAPGTTNNNHGVLHNNAHQQTFDNTHNNNHHDHSGPMHTGAAMGGTAVPHNQSVDRAAYQQNVAPGQIQHSVPAGPTGTSNIPTYAQNVPPIAAGVVPTAHIAEVHGDNRDNHKHSLFGGHKKDHNDRGLGAHQQVHQTAAGGAVPPVNSNNATNVPMQQQQPGAGAVPVHSMNNTVPAMGAPGTTTAAGTHVPGAYNTQPSSTANPNIHDPSRPVA